MKAIAASLLCLLQLIAAPARIEWHDDWAYITRLMEPYNRRSKHRIAECTIKYSYKYGHDPKMISRLQRRESDYRHWIINGYGAHGLMQVVPRHWNHIPHSFDKVSPRLVRTGNYSWWWTRIGYNIEGGCKVLAYYRSRYPLPLALLAYNRGENSKYFRLALQHPIFWVEDDYVQEVLGE
jgi:soluble lytic murein transglycosylase-like protein